MNEDPLEPRDGESAEAREIRELQSLVTGLRGTMHIVALCGIVVAGSFFLYVHKQVEGLQRQAAELSAYVADYQKTFAPQLENARSNLFLYARENPGVAPILNKYFTNAPASSVAPAPRQ